jgi:hypothetical protein
LIFGHRPRGWNRRDEASAAGQLYLAALDNLAFGAHHTGPFEFVDEFELRGRTETEKDGWPDQAVVWADRVLLIELKTERGSHRPGQCETYLELGRHHYPAKPVDLIYITPTATYGLRADAHELSRYRHLTWPEIAVLIEQVWLSGPNADERELAQFLLAFLGSLDQPREARESSVLPPVVVAPSPPAPVRVPTPPSGDWTTEALDSAAAVASDHGQRAVSIEVTDPERLVDARIELGDRLQATGGELSRVRPWIWRQAQSGGKPLTELGERTGYELRLSYYPERGTVVAP